MSVLKTIMSLREIYKIAAEITAEIEHYEASLCSLRFKRPKDNNWEEGIEKDTRPPIKLLYTTLVSKREELNQLLDTKVLPVHSKSFPCETCSIVNKDICDVCHEEHCKDHTLYKQVTNEERNCETCKFNLSDLCNICFNYDAYSHKSKKIEELKSCDTCKYSNNTRFRSRMRVCNKCTSYDKWEEKRNEEKVKPSCVPEGHPDYEFAGVTKKTEER